MAQGVSPNSGGDFEVGFVSPQTTRTVDKVHTTRSKVVDSSPSEKVTIDLSKTATVNQSSESRNLSKKVSISER